MNIAELMWILFWGQFTVINSIREIVFYGLQGKEIPLISYWGYVLMLTGIMITPTVLGVLKDKKVL
jgi:hypothetical protein